MISLLLKEWLPMEGKPQVSRSSTQFEHVPVEEADRNAFVARMCTEDARHASRTVAQYAARQDIISQLRILM
jgi:hypothetical protein